MRVPLLLWSVPLAALTGFAAARRWRAEPWSGTEESAARQAPAPVMEAASRSAPALTRRGSEAVPELFAVLQRASAADLRGMAMNLLTDPARRRDFGLWGPLLARWAETDGPGLIDFVSREAPPSERAWLESKAWFSWGAARPAAAAAAARELPAALAADLIRGMAETDAAAAAGLALQLPGAAENLYDIAAKVAQSSPELIADLLPRLTYESMRQPLRQAQASALAVTNPSAALALARQSGNLGHDPVPVTMKQIARQDPARAAELFAQMPSSRSKALSAAVIAKTWAGDDSAAAAAWARGSLTGSVRQAALLEIAAVSGGPDPLTALRIVEEAGWQPEPDFYAVSDGGPRPAAEARSRPAAERTAGLLLQQLAALDPGGARRWLEQSVPADRRDAVARIAGLSPEP
jgi:hypothetical protein